MIETATLISLCLLYLIFFRPGKTPALESPLVIERPGQYHLTFAPQLNLAQPFIEAIIKQLVNSSTQDTATQFFVVWDKQVSVEGFDFYLLAITRRNGILFFQAARPPSLDESSYLQFISEISHAVLARLPDDEEHESGENIVAAVQQVAGPRGIRIKAL
jgi:hypothetical protein